MKAKHQILWLGLVILIAAIAVHVTGGDLNPGNSPSPTMRTLDEVYKNIQPGLPSDWVPFAKEQQVTGNSSIHLFISSNSNPLDGSCEVQGKEDSIVIVGLGHHFELPYDAAAGQVTHQRIHNPIIVSKYIDQSSPLFYKALVNGEEITAELKFYRTSQAGPEQHYYKIRLERARIVDIKMAFPNIEQVSIAYEKIIWEWVPGGVIYEDDWRQPG